ncbi:MAG: diguanylate cyclase [Pseudomonadota bacterium]
MDSEHLAHLVEANENLVLAVLQAHAQRQAAEKKMSELAESVELDVLTRLPNRTVLMDRLDHAIVNAKRRGDKLAVLFIDLNKFKHLNDTLGHAAGHLALKIAADCLSTAVREADTVSRYGGDEFVVLLEKVSAVADVKAIVDKILISLGATNRVGSHVVRLTASVGISLYPEDSDEAETLITLADRAMYAAKRIGNGNGKFAFAGKQYADDSDNQETAAPLANEIRLAKKEQRRDCRRSTDEKMISEVLSAKELQAGAEQALRRQTEFMALLVHELCGPLGPIRNAAMLIHPARHDDATSEKLQGIIERQITHLSRLLADVFDMSRIATGKMRLERHRTDITEVLKQAMERVQSSMGIRRQILHSTLPGYPVEIDGDSVRLVQIFGNLLDNASKYSPEDSQITLTVEVDETSVTIKVIDTGIGITAEALPSVFDMFAQDKHATRFDGKGLGIGLALVKEFVEAHEGVVTAHSEGPGRGSLFVVIFPLRVEVLD